MPNTNHFSFPYPDGAQIPDAPQWLKDLAVAVDTALHGINQLASKVVPSTGGTFTGRISIPDATSDSHAVTKRQLDGKANSPLSPRPATWGAGTGNPVMVRGASSGDAGPVVGVRWFPLPQSDSRHPGVFRWAVDAADYGVMAIDAPSDPRMKTRTDSDPDYAGFVAAVPVATYTYTDEVGARWAGTSHAGFMADDVQSAAAQFGLPEGVVETDADGNAVAVNTTDLLAALWHVVQQQQQRIEALEQR